MIINFTLDDKSNLIDLPDNQSVVFINPFVGNTDVISKFMKHLFFMLKMRNYSVDGINLKFAYSTYSKGVVLSEMYNDEFRICFSSSGIYSINIPKIELNYYDDTDTYKLYRYVGDDWDADKNQFINGHRCNSRLRGKKKIYLVYDMGSRKINECQVSQNYHKKMTRLMKLESVLNDGVNLYDFTNITSSNRTLVYNNDLDREYSPDNNEISYYSINDILFEVFTWLYNNVYLKVKNSKESDEVIQPNVLFKKPEKIKITNSEYIDYTYKLDTNIYFRYNDMILPTDGLLMPTLRFLPLSTIVNDNLKYASIVYDACFEFRPMNDDSKILSYLLVSLKYANHVYVYNLDEIGVDNIVKSIIPINEYRHNYEKPALIIKRGLYPDEYKIFDNTKSEINKNNNVIDFDELLNF